MSPEAVPSRDYDFSEVLILTPAETMEIRDLVWHLNEALTVEHPAWPLVERIFLILKQAGRSS